MKLSKAESKAVKFVLFMVALSAFARWRSQPDSVVVDTSGIVSSPTDSVSRSSARTGPIDPSTATLAELDRLPGVGPKTAARIIEHRPYRDLNDLGKVIGMTRARRLAARLTLAKGAERLEHEQGDNAETRQTAVPLNLNQATPAELEKLPGIGPALAHRIIARRDSLGGFRSWPQLDSVSGVGPALLRKIKAAVVL